MDNEWAAVCYPRWLEALDRLEEYGASKSELGPSPKKKALLELLRRLGYHVAVVKAAGKQCYTDNLSPSCATPNITQPRM